MFKEIVCWYLIFLKLVSSSCISTIKSCCCLQYLSQRWLDFVDLCCGNVVFWVVGTWWDQIVWERAEGNKTTETNRRLWETFSIFSYASTHLLSKLCISSGCPVSRQFFILWSRFINGSAQLHIWFLWSHLSAPQVCSHLALELSRHVKMRWKQFHMLSVRTHC